MPVFQDQQAVQQLLSGLNTMQMQAGLMPGGVPLYNPASGYGQPEPPQPPGEFSNQLRVRYQNTFSPVVTLPPMYSGVAPVPRNEFAQGILPGAQLSGGWGLARQNAQSTQNNWLTGTQAISAIGMRSAVGLAGGAFGATAGTLLGGPVGGVLGGLAGSYMADTLFGGAAESMANIPFQHFIQQRQRSLSLQNASMGFVRTGGELSASGMGLTMTASMDLEKNLSRMTDDRTFRRDTGGAFNRQDMMRITALSAQTGMLDQSQSVEQITRDMGKISRALTTFMRVVEEPDVQTALQMMGRMRSLGMALPEMNQAAANARTFARMAGTSVQSMMQAGVEGAGTFQQMGMAGATGFQTGIAAAGTAGLMAGMLDPRRLSMLGGQQGIQSNLTAAAGQVSQMDILLPGLLRQGQNGLTIDQDALMGLASGKRNINELVQQSSQRLAGMGPRGFLQEYATRRNELRDELMNSFGGQGAVLAPMLIARSIEATGATDFRGALRMMNLDEQQARTVELANTPEFFRRLRQQQGTDAINQQGVRATQRQRTFEEADAQRRRQLLRAVTPDFMRGMYNSMETLHRDTGRWFQREFGEDQDVEEQRAIRGGGEVLAYNRASTYGSEEQAQMLRQQLQTPEGSERIYGQMGALQQNIDRVRTRRTERVRELEGWRRNLTRYGGAPGLVYGALLDAFSGEEGFGVRRNTRGNEGLDRVVMQNETFGTRVKDYLTLTGQRTEDEVNQRAVDMMRGGAAIEQARTQRFDLGRLNTLQRESGLDADRFEQARVQAAATINRYARESADGWLLGDNEGFSMQEAQMRVRRQLQSSLGLSAEQVGRVVNDQFMVEGIRVGDIGRGATERAFLAQGEAAGGNIAAYLDTTNSNLTRREGDTARARLISSIGLDPDKLDAAQGKQLVNFFSEEGPEADARRALFEVQALRSLGTEEADRRAAQRVGEVQRMGLTEDQQAGALAAAQGLTTNLGEKVMRQVGNAFRATTAAGAEARDTRIREDADLARAADLHAALTERLTEEGARAFESGRKRGKGTETLAKYLAQGGRAGETLTEDERRRIQSGAMTDEELESLVTGDIKYRAQAAIEGGHTQQAGPEATGTTVANRIIEVLAAAAEQDRQVMQASFGKFDTAVDKFSTATATLNNAAASFANLDSLMTLQDFNDRAKKTASQQSTSE